ncbi:hypothetical protein J4G02_05205 [Candidatus Poribacteria bacterium]|nr:hypothetical protein [Candidatus Poribacteria bacterium]
MRMLGNKKIRHIARILQYVPVVVTFFFALSFWRKGFNEGAVAIGAVCIGLLLLNLLLHIDHIGDKIMAIRKPLGLVASVIIISIGVYSLAIGSIYAGIFYVLLGMTFLFMEILKGKWGVICCAAVLVLAVGVLILEAVNSNKPPAVEREMGVQQVMATQKRFHA